MKLTVEYKHHNYIIHVYTIVYIHYLYCYYTITSSGWITWIVKKKKKCKGGLTGL